MGQCVGMLGIWILQKTLQELEHMPKENILSVDEEIEYFLSLALSMAAYFGKSTVAATIDLALELNNSKLR